MLPFETPYHAGAFIAIGILSAWLAGDAIALVPLCAVLMLAIGMMMQVDAHQFPAMQNFVACTILLFALGVGMLRNKAFLLCIPPIALWCYFAGGEYMTSMPTAAPLYLLQGMVERFGARDAAEAHGSMRKFRHLPRVMTFLSFF